MTFDLSRRRLIRAGLLLAAAPMIVRASSLMHVKGLPALPALPPPELTGYSFLVRIVSEVLLEPISFRPFGSVLTEVDKAFFREAEAAVSDELDKVTLEVIAS